MSGELVKDTNFNMRLNKYKKNSLEDLYGIPFDVRVPKYNKETISAIQEAKDIMSGKIEAMPYSSAKELLDGIDAE